MTEMNRLRSMVVAVAIAMTLPFAAAPLMAQRAAPPGTGETFKDTSMLKPPAGAKIAIYELEDLECPACSHAAPVVHAAAAHYNIPLMQHDFPLQYHLWSLDAMIWARYLEDKVSPKMGDEYRGAVFAARGMLTSATMIVAFWLQFGTALFRRTAAPTVFFWLGVGSMVVAVLAGVMVQTRKQPVTTGTVA